MTSEEIVLGVCSWLMEANPELTHAYAYAPMMKESALPDVVVELDIVTLEVGDAAFPLRDIQQRFLTRWQMTVSFMVLNEDPSGAATQLRTFADRCVDEILADSTLRGRVPFVSPFVTFDYTPPFVEYADGTRGREMTMSLSVGELVEVQQ